MRIYSNKKKQHLLYSNIKDAAFKFINIYKDFKNKMR